YTEGPPFGRFLCDWIRGLGPPIPPRPTASPEQVPPIPSTPSWSSVMSENHAEYGQTRSEPKREKIIKVRVSPEELATLKMHSTRDEPARWMRETCLNPGQVDLVKGLKGPAPVDPDLLRQLASIGNNLNQIARRVNTGDW